MQFIRERAMSSSELSTSDLDDELLEMVALEDGFVLPEGDCSPSADGAVAYPASPSASIASSIADVTDGSSDAGESIDATPIKKLSSDGKIDNRTAKKNRARLHRYYRSKSELAELRVQVLELQTLLDRLKAEGDDPIVSSTWLSTSPSPFTDDKIDEINPNARAPPKSKTTSVSRADGWKDAALVEHLRHRRAVTVRRKLKRMIKEYGQGTEAFMEWWAALQQVRALSTIQGHFPFVTFPRIPGVDTLGAFIHNGPVFLRELYHMACSTAQISPASSVPLADNGRPLAYSVFLGSSIERGWKLGFSLPGDDPEHITNVYFHALATQPADPLVVSVIGKTHEFEHPCHERRMRRRLPTMHPKQKPIEIEGVKFMQMFESNGDVVLVWAAAAHLDVESSPSLLRASGWMVLAKSKAQAGDAPTCVISGCSRVHAMSPGETAALEEHVPRRVFVNGWAETMQAKQRTMQQRLLLLA